MMPEGIRNCGHQWEFVGWEDFSAYPSSYSYHPIRVFVCNQCRVRITAYRDPQSKIPQET